MGKKNVNMRTIARECGVSINTVSHALRDFSDISRATKQKVWAKAVELGYMPNVVSQQLKNEERPVVAILIDSFTNLYFSILCNEFIKIIGKNKEYDVQVLYFNNNYMDILKQCVLQRVDMVITHALLSADEMEFAKLNNIRVLMVGVDNLKTNADVVTVDELTSCEQAARYLWGIHKGDKFMYVGFDSFLSNLRYRYFKQTLNDLGATDVINFDVHKDDVHALLKCISNGYKSLFFYDDAMAYRILGELDAILVDVRKAFPDLHLVGFDGLCENINGMKQISTILIDYKEFAKAIYETIRFRFNNPKADYKRTIITTKIHQRRNG